MFLLGNPKKEFGKRLQEIRDRRGFTQISLGVALGKKGSAAISAWEQGRTWPRADELKALSRVLGVPPGELLADKVVVREPSKEEILETVRKGLESLEKEESATPRGGVFDLILSLSAEERDYLHDIVAKAFPEKAARFLKSRK